MMNSSKNLIVLSLAMLLVACNEESTKPNPTQLNPEEAAQAYQDQRPYDEGRHTNQYDPDMPALYVAEEMGSYIPGSQAIKNSGDQIYQIDALAVSMGGKCFTKKKNIPSKRSQWGVKSGNVVRLQPTHFTSEKFAERRARWHDVVYATSLKFGMDPNIIHGIITQESGYNPKAFNKGSSATGMMQIIPVTQSDLGMGPGDAWIPEKNIYHGTKYFSRLHKRFKGNTALALAGYNAGPGHVDWCGDAIPPFKETQDYVAKITGYANVYAKNPPVKKSNDRKNK